LKRQIVDAVSGETKIVDIELSLKFHEDPPVRDLAKELDDLIAKLKAANIIP